MVPKRVLVTGGNKGIGKAVCQRLLEEYDDVHVLLASRDLKRGEQAVEDLLQAVGEDCSERIELIQLDTTCDVSVRRAAEKVAQSGSLYGIVNNAGIGFGFGVQETLNVNYFGVRRVNDAFENLLERPGGRIVNMGSASGPNFVAKLADGDLKEMLTKPWTIKGGIAQLDEIARNIKTDNGYGSSKALLNAYTVIHAKMEKDVIINSCSPGWILTDLTKGMGASNPPSKGAVCPVWALMSADLVDLPTGRYYGSDCVRSPLHYYRDPGEAPYVSDEDLVDLSAVTSRKSGTD
jgi:NAD(P)-dependent dehydrogenase (short-subunit alcohol dehydrogenase family)